MAIRLGIVVLLLALTTFAMVGESSSSVHVSHWSHYPTGDGGLIVDTLDIDEEGMMESESARRQLARARRISYGAMMKDKVPCNKRGRSYYDCTPRKANPYTRGCNRITRCGGRGYQ